MIKKDPVGVAFSQQVWDLPKWVLWWRWISRIPMLVILIYVFCFPFLFIYFLLWRNGNHVYICYVVFARGYDCSCEFAFRTYYWTEDKNGDVYVIGSGHTFISLLLVPQLPLQHKKIFTLLSWLIKEVQFDWFQ